jgi:hypothetical protein
MLECWPPLRPVGLWSGSGLGENIGKMGFGLTACGTNGKFILKKVDNFIYRPTIPCLRQTLIPKKIPYIFIQLK